MKNVKGLNEVKGFRELTKEEKNEVKAKGDYSCWAKITYAYAADIIMNYGKRYR